MNNLDKQWLIKCINNPKRYKIYVDNDDIFIVNQDSEEEEVLYSFDNFGYDFIVDLLKFLQCNVDYV